MDHAISGQQECVVEMNQAGKVGKRTGGCVTGSPRPQHKAEVVTRSLEGQRDRGISQPL